MFNFIPIYPSATINVIDNSIYTAAEEEVLPCGMQLYCLQAYKGPVNIPVWCKDYATAVSIFGEQTFDESNKDYFSIEAKFLKKVLEFSGCWIVNLSDDTAVASTLVLEMAITSGVDVIQYEKDADGYRVLDENGDPVPLQNEGVNVTATGIRVRHTVRALTSNESLDSLTKATVDATVTYPLMVFQASSAGVWANSTGFKLSFNYSDQLTRLLNDTGALFYNFAPIEKKYKATTATPIYDIYDNNVVSFCLKPNQKDSATNSNVSIKEILESHYTDSDTLPFVIYPYYDNIKEVGDVMLAAEGALDNVVDGYTMDILSCRNLNGVLYDKVELDLTAGSVLYSENAIHYMLGGADGTRTQTAHEERVRNFFDGTSFPAIVDSLRFPFNMIVDPGYAIDTKYKMIDFMNLRDDVHIFPSTQDVSIEQNDEAADLSTGIALRSRALLVRESIIKGTSCCRCSVIQHSGNLLDTSYTGLVPMTYEVAAKLSEAYRKPNLYTSLAGRDNTPGSEITLFDIDSINWTAYSNDTKERSWTNGLNYIQYADRNTLFFPALRTVYIYNTSALVSVETVNFICMTKQLTQRVWTIFSDVQLYFGDLKLAVENRLNKEMSVLNNNKYNIVPTLWQTEEEQAIGYVKHITWAFEAPDNNRNWNVDINVTREGYTSAS